MSFQYKKRLCFDRSTSKNKAWTLNELLSDDDVKEVVKRYGVRRTKGDICTKLEELSKRSKKKEDEGIRDDEEEKFDIDRCTSYKVAELKSRLSKLKLPVSGTKAVLCERLKKYYEGIRDEEKDDFDINRCTSYKVIELKSKLSKLKLPVYGTKAVLCERLKQHHKKMKDYVDKEEKEEKEEKEDIKNILIKKCPVYEKCPRGYTKKDLVSLAVECGVETKEGEKTLTMKIICDNLIKKYGYRSDKNTKIKHIKYVNNTIIEINTFKHDRKRRIEELLNYIIDKDVVNSVDDKDFSQKLGEEIKGWYDKFPFVSEFYEAIFGEELIVKNRKCINKTTPIALLDIDDIEQKKYIKLSNGYCYDVDELLEVMIISKDENINPSDTSRLTKIWESEDEKNRIINHKGADPNIKKRYKEMLHLKEEDEKKILKEIGKDTKILDKIAEAGFKCLNDRITSKDDKEVFVEAQKVLENLRDYINNSSRKVFYENMNVGSLRVGTILDSVHSECIHGIGIKLLTIYTTWYNRISNVYPDLKLSKYFIQISDIYVTTGLRFDNDDNPSYIHSFYIMGIYVDNPIVKRMGIIGLRTPIKPKSINDYIVQYDFDSDTTSVNLIVKNKKKIVDYFYDIVNL